MQFYMKRIRLTTAVVWMSLGLFIPGSAHAGPAKAESAVRPQDGSRRSVEHAASALYNKALEKFQLGTYWKSALDLVVLLDYYPQFSKIDGVMYHLGVCLYEMEMYDGADRVFRFLLKAAPKTPWLPEALLGLQKIYYQKNNYQQSLKFYKALEAHYSDRKLIDESRYYAGQSYYHSRSYDLVPEIFRHITRRSEFYPFGQYTAGLAQLKKKMSPTPWRPSSV